MTTPDKPAEVRAPLVAIDRKYSRCGFFSIVMMFAVVFSLNSAFAADAKITPKVGVSGGYDDNIFLTSDDKVDSAILIASPGIAIDYQTLLTAFTLTADLDIRSYLDESDLNRTNQYYDISVDHRPKERWTTSADIKFYRDTTLDSFLQETGRVFERTERDFFEIGGGAGYNLTLVSRISGGYRFQHAEYDSDTISDFSRHSGYLNYSHRLKNEVDTLSIGPSYTHRSNDFNKVDSFALNLGWARNWSEITRSRATIGARYTTIEQNDGTKDDNWGVRAGLNIDRQGLLSTTTFRYFHELRTTVEGSDVNVDNFFLSYRRPITERFGTAIEGRLVFSYKLLDRQTDVNDERFFLVEPRFFYKLTQNLDLSLRYRYQQNFEDRDNGDITRERNTIWLQLEYALPIPL